MYVCVGVCIVRKYGLIWLRPHSGSDTNPVNSYKLGFIQRVLLYIHGFEFSIMHKQLKSLLLKPTYILVIA